MSCHAIRLNNTGTTYQRAMILAPMPFKNCSTVVNQFEHQGFDEYQIRIFKLIQLIKNVFVSIKYPISLSMCFNCLRINKAVLSIKKNSFLNITIMESVPCILLEKSRKKQDVEFRRMCLQNIRRENSDLRSNTSSRKMTQFRRENSRDMLFMRLYILKASSACFIDIFKKSKR